VNAETKPTLMVIDGHSLAFRAFYALPLDTFVTRDGQHTNAIHGFLSMLLSLLQQHAPTHLAVAFDLSRYSFRTREYPEYKATRGETPPEFIGQVPLLQEALAAMHIPVITKEDYEADDILATLSKQGADQGFRVLLVSGDRDTIQLVNDDVTLLYPSVRGVSELKHYDPAAVQKRYGIRPEQYPDIAALVGETSDNLIGVDKVGEKTAVKWITQYGSLEGLLEHLDEIKGVVGQNLRDQQDRAIRNRKLNRLVTDVELPLGPADLARQEIDPVAVKQVFDRLQFRTLLERVLKLAGVSSADLPASSEGPTSGGGASLVPDAPAVQTLIDEELAAWLQRASAAGPVAVHVDAPGGVLNALGLASESEAVVVPWGSGRQDYVALETWLASDAPKVGFDLKQASKVLIAAGLRLGGVVGDAKLAAQLSRGGVLHGSLNVDAVTLIEQHLGVVLSQPDPNHLVPETEPTSPGLLAWYFRLLVQRLEESLEPGVLRVYQDLEVPLTPILAVMESTGIAVDGAALRSLSAELGERAAGLQTEAWAAIEGFEVNLGSPKQLQEVLFERLGLPKTRATKTGYSTDAEAIAELQLTHPHPFLSLLLGWRDVTKLRQIVDSLEKTIASDGRVHTKYDQIGSATGRFSSTDPNLQNVPVKTAEGRRIRAAFHAGEGYPALLTADYSQIEMRIMAHLSGDPGLIEAFNQGEDLHRFVGARIFDVAPEDVTPLQRGKVKAMSYGLAYGLSAYGLSRQLQIPVSEAKQLMTDYFERFGAIRDYLRNVVEQAKADGYTETIFGRRRYFPDLRSSNRVLKAEAERQALNSPIQGTAADIIKRAMVDVAAAIEEQQMQSRLLLQVHDELVFELAEGEESALRELVAAKMAGAAALSVPLEVSIGVGHNWDEAAH